MAIYPILRLIYRLLQLKIRPNYDCKLGITRKLAINKRLLEATPSTPTIVPTHPYATKKGARPFPRPSGKSGHGPKKRSRSLDLLALTFPAHAQHFGQHPGSNERMGVTELKVLMSSYLWIVKKVS